MRKIPVYEITYKSGRVVKIRAKDLKVTWRNVGAEQHVTQLAWGSIKPEGMYIGLDNIESVWRVK